MKKIIKKARSFSFHSFQYVVPQDSIMKIEKPDCILICEEDGEKINVHWACESLESLLVSLNELSKTIRGNEITLQFIPPEFLDSLEGEGYKLKCEFVDFWIKDLSQMSFDSPYKTCIRTLRHDEIAVASSITKSCKGLSRGFYGEDEDFIANWLKDENSEVFVAIEDDKYIGVCLMKIYDNSKGKVAWLRELAVHPQFQNRGVGKTLAKCGLAWGKNKGAGMSFLAVEVENTPAISVYKKLGFKQNDGRGEIRVSKITTF